MFGRIRPSGARKVALLAEAPTMIPETDNGNVLRRAAEIHAFSLFIQSDLKNTKIRLNIILYFYTPNKQLRKT